MKNQDNTLKRIKSTLLHISYFLYYKPSENTITSTIFIDELALNQFSVKPLSENI